MSSLYGKSKWRKKAKAQLSKEPLCRMCFENRKLTVAKQADHINPWNTESEFWNGKLQSLCHACHNLKTAMDNQEIRRQKIIQKKTAWNFL